MQKVTVDSSEQTRNHKQNFVCLIYHNFVNIHTIHLTSRWDYAESRGLHSRQGSALNKEVLLQCLQGLAQCLLSGCCSQSLKLGSAGWHLLRRMLNWGAYVIFSRPLVQAMADLRQSATVKGMKES